MNEEKKKSIKKNIAAALVIGSLAISTMAAMAVANGYVYRNKEDPKYMYALVDLFSFEYVDLPNETQVEQGLERFTDASFYAKAPSESKYLRFEIKKGEPIKFYVPSTATESQKNRVKQTMDLYNELFSSINEEYKFVYTEDEASCKEKSTIYFSFVDEVLAQNQKVIGSCDHNWTYGQDYQKKIKSVNIKIKNNAPLRVYVHEVFHAFGAYDFRTYENNCRVDSIMNDSYNPRNQLKIPKNDFYMLACNYTNMTDEANIERVNANFKSFDAKQNNAEASVVFY